MSERFKTDRGAVTTCMADLYSNLHDRLDFVRIKAAVVVSGVAIGDAKLPLSHYVDIDAICQQFCVEVEKRIGRMV